MILKKNPWNEILQHKGKERICITQNYSLWWTVQARNRKEYQEVLILQIDEIYTLLTLENNKVYATSL